MSDKEIAPPLAAEDKDGKATYKQIVKFVRSVRRDQGRVNTLRLWEPIWRDGKCINGISTVWHTDHPSIQALIERRDRYSAIRKRTEELKEILDNAELEAEVRVAGYATYERLQSRMEKELEAIEQCLLDLRREFAASAKTMATILVEAAKLRHNRQTHQDRMDLARNSDPSQLSEADLMKIADSDTL